LDDFLQGNPVGEKKKAADKRKQQDKERRRGGPWKFEGIEKKLEDLYYFRFGERKRPPPGY